MNRIEAAKDILKRIEAVDPKDDGALDDYKADITLKWVPLDDYQGYVVSRNGEIYSTKRPGKKKQSFSRQGYLRVNLYSSNLRKNRMWTVHRLVALAFHPNPDNKPQVCHRDGNKLNNNSDNLYWGTQKENTEDAIRHGTYKGEKNGRSQLTKTQVEALKITYDMVENGCKDRFANLFKQHPSTIKRAIRGDTWKH